MLNGGPPSLAAARRAWASGPAEVWSLRLADLDGRELDDSTLDPDERHRAAQLSAPGDQLSFVARHVLLRGLLGARLACPPQELRFVRQACPLCDGAHGRPALRDDSSGLHFSTARSAGVVMVGIARSPIGVDVEAFVDQVVLSEVSGLLHPQERCEILAAPLPEQPATFARAWTRKEAYLKGIGTGVAGKLEADYLGVHPHVDAPSGWQILDLPIADGYAAAAAIARPRD